MSDRLSLANEVKQLKEEQERKANEWKEGQTRLEAKVAQLVQANMNELEPLATPDGNTPEDHGEVCPA